MRAVLDVNVLVSAVLSRNGTPARLLAAWREGAFELVVSANLIEELRRTLEYPKLRRFIQEADAEQLAVWLETTADVRPDPTTPSVVRSADPNDDYLIALAWAERAALVSGDRHLLDVDAELPIYSPADFLALLEKSPA